jgi:outer membrane protein assembly factor BamD
MKKIIRKNYYYLCITMKKQIIILVATLSIIISFNACSKFNKIQKSTDMEAKYQAAVKYYEKKNYFQALQLFEELITVFRGTNRAEDTYYYYSQCYYETGDYTVAAYHFNNFNQTFPNSSRAEEALYKNAYCYYLDSPVASLDQKNTLDAIRQFQLFINKYPHSEKVQQSNELIDELRFKLETKEFNNAKLYFKTGNNKSAVLAFQNVLKTYPSTTYKEECLFYILRSSYLYANQSIDTKKPERYKNTIENYYKLIDTFPQTKYLREAERIFVESQARIKKLENSASVS